MAKSEYKKMAEEKFAAKKALYEKCYPDADSKIPLLMIFGPSREKDDEQILQLLEGLLIMPMRVIVVSDNEPEDAVKHPCGKVTWISSEDGRAQSKINDYLLAADMALVYDESHGNLANIMANGTVVIGNEISPFLQNYHPNEESGNSFTFASSNPWEMFRAVVRAQETFRFPFDWQNLVKGLI